MLVAQPGLGADNVHVAAARADAAALRRLLAADPALANVEGGPFGWPPLLYLAYARHDPDVTADAVRDAVAALTGAGADPGAGYLWHGNSPPFTALTGAFGEGEGGPDNQPGHPQWEAMARALLEAGADPNDAQTLYNRTFRPDDSHLVLLFEYGLDDADELAFQLGWAVAHGMDARVRAAARTRRRPGHRGRRPLRRAPGARRTPPPSPAATRHRRAAAPVRRLGRALGRGRGGGRRAQRGRRRHRVGARGDRGPAGAGGVGGAARQRRRCAPRGRARLGRRPPRPDRRAVRPGVGDRAARGRRQRRRGDGSAAARARAPTPRSPTPGSGRRPAQWAVHFGHDDLAGLLSDRSG